LGAKNNIGFWIWAQRYRKDKKTKRMCWEKHLAGESDWCDAIFTTKVALYCDVHSTRTYTVIVARETNVLWYQIYVWLFCPCITLFP